MDKKNKSVKQLLIQLKIFNMKKLLTLFFILLTFITPAFAATSTPTPTKSESDKMEAQITDLKDRVASRVAQLKLVEKRAFTGTVNDVSNTEITIKNMQQENQIIDVDEITKFSSLDNKDTNFGISDLKKGMDITALGLYNKESDKLLARFVAVITSPVFVFGKVTNIDRKEYTMTVTTSDNKNMVVDIETTTKTVDYTSHIFTKAGFSKVSLNDQVAVIGYPNNKGPNRIEGGRIMILNNLSNTPSPSVTTKP